MVGSGTMAERLAGGNDAIALLGNTLSTASLLVVLILTLGPVSGAHFNPAVTLCFWMRREIRGRDALRYVAAQIGGGLVGVALAHAMFGLPLFEIGTRARSAPSLWLAEAVATLGLVATILGTLRHRPDRVCFTVGLYIAAAYWFTASTSFANPAVTIARSLTRTFSGIAWDHAPAFIAVQLLAAALATPLFGWLFGRGAAIASRLDAC